MPTANYILLLPRGYIGPGGLHEGGAYSNCTGGAAGYIDRAVFGSSHVYSHPTSAIIYNSNTAYDPEGLLGSLTSVLMVGFSWQQICTFGMPFAFCSFNHLIYYIHTVKRFNCTSTIWFCSCSLQYSEKLICRNIIAYLCNAGTVWSSMWKDNCNLPIPPRTHYSLGYLGSSHRKFLWHTLSED